MKTLRLALAAFAALTLCACYPPTTSHPVGTTSGLKPDSMLAGLWKGEPPQPGERGAYFHFLPQADGTMTTLLVQSGDQPDGDWNLVSLTTARAGTNRFMNARMLSSNGKPEEGSPEGTIPVLYRIDSKGRLTLYLMDEKSTKAAIAAGQIEGSLGEGESGDAVITAQPAALDKFMASAAARALFVKPFFTLRKLD